MTGHYDLFERSDCQATSVLIVSPFVEKTFFERIVSDLAPEELIVVIDDGCRADELKMLFGLERKGTKVYVALGGARGLVHAKIFHLEWRTSGGQRAHSFVYGSGNATCQAFKGNINSELMCETRLIAAHHGSLLKWLDGVRAAARNPSLDGVVIEPLRDFWVSDKVRVRLPGMTIKDPGDKANNFDLWLQRGRLLSMYQPDAGFLRVPVVLLAELPPGDLAQSVEKIGFQIPQQKRLSIPYISVAGDLDNGDSDVDSPGNWRSKYFIWTNIGLWCSQSCFQKMHGQFKKNRHEERLQNIKMLRALRTSESINAARLHFLYRVDRLWEALGVGAGNYLESADGILNRPFYQNLFNQRVERDLSLADDPEFVARYVNG